MSYDMPFDGVRRTYYVIIAGTTEIVNIFSFFFFFNLFAYVFISHNNLYVLFSAR